MTTKILTYSFHLLFFLTPLIWFPLNHELFEYNKMMFVYGLTVIITGSWVLKMINKKELIIKRTPLDIPLLLFLLANILSTVFSIDPHLSIWGYYSRSNGGLLSLISYLLLYWALVSNFQTEEGLKFLKSAVLGAVAVSFWAIPEHFGVSPSCIILTGQLNTSCWVQDVQARVFATLGQPNWLAAYLVMLIFPALYFLLTSKNKKTLITYGLSLITLYAAFTFTYSRGATLGLLGGLILFLAPIFLFSNLVLSLINSLLYGAFLISSPSKPPKISGVYKKLIGGVIAAFIAINLIFGSAFTDFKIFSLLFSPAKPSGSLSTTNTSAPSLGTQLETGGTESGKIRLIVWKGALEIFKHYPLFGSGVETFAYAYYQYRPIEHNLVSEWDFLYNKAHNEFLNYLANTGLFGFLSYITVILTFIFFCIKYYVSGIKDQNYKAYNIYPLILIPSLLASYVSYLVQNFFSFSVVSIALLFYLLPALAFLATKSVKPLTLPTQLRTIAKFLYTTLYRHIVVTYSAKFIVIVVCMYFLLTLSRFWTADIFFAEGSKANEINSVSKAYKNLISATRLNPQEPYYRSELGFAAASAAVLLSEEDASSSADFKNQALNQTSNVLNQHPFNISFYRTAVRTYFLLSTIDESYLEKSLDTLESTILLAPTDPKLTYNKAVILESMGKSKEAITFLEKTVEMKPNYKDARLALGKLYFQGKKKDKAIEQATTLLNYYPKDTDAAEKLQEWSR